MFCTALWLTAEAGCARFEPAQIGRLQAAHAAIAAAEALAPATGSVADRHLRLARAQASLAEQLVAQQHPHRAQGLLARAEADAALALTLAREAPARALAQDALDQLDALDANAAGAFDAAHATNAVGADSPAKPNEPGATGSRGADPAVARPRRVLP